MTPKSVILCANDPGAAHVLEELERSIVVDGMLRAIARGVDFQRETIVEHGTSLKEAQPGDRILRTRTVEFDDGSAFSVWFEYRGNASMVIVGADREHLVH